MGKWPKLSSSFCLYMALALLIFPIKWLFAALLAAGVHELCHYFAIMLCTGEKMPLYIHFCGARMPLPEMRRGEELLCALAGPIGGLLLLPLAPVFPRLAVCGLFQSLYNLLPVYPLDGGRILSCIASMSLKPAYAQWICSFIQWLCLGVLLAVGVYAAAILKLGLWPLLLCAGMVLKAKNEKYSCKPVGKALQ